jgi:hypothetical protein
VVAGPHATPHGPAVRRADTPPRPGLLPAMPPTGLHAPRSDHCRSLGPAPHAPDHPSVPEGPPRSSAGHPGFHVAVRPGAPFF